MQFTKIPSVFRRFNLADIDLSPEIHCEEGAVIVAQALNEDQVRNPLELSTGRLGTLVEGDIIPGVLGKRRASREFSGDIPNILHVEDTLYLLGSSGVLGQIRGGDPKWGRAMGLKVLGSVIRQGRPLNLKDAAIPSQTSLDTCAPIVAVLATSMETGKTTTSCQIAKHFKRQGLKVAYAKLTGFSYQTELLTVQDFGADWAMDFVDGGLPSTCGDPERVVTMALSVLTALNLASPDLMIVEFGSSLLAEYHVDTLLAHPDIRKHIRATVVGASDTVAAWGARESLSQLNLPISVITGPVANNPTEIVFLQEKLGLVAETNLKGSMPKTMEILTEALASSAAS
jgi:hypothetical protein